MLLHLTRGKQSAPALDGLDRPNEMARVALRPPVLLARMTTTTKWRSPIVVTVIVSLSAGHGRAEASGGHNYFKFVLGTQNISSTRSASLVTASIRLHR